MVVLVSELPVSENKPISSLYVSPFKDKNITSWPMHSAERAFIITWLQQIDFNCCSTAFEISQKGLCGITAPTHSMSTLWKCMKTKVPIFWAIVCVESSVRNKERFNLRTWQNMTIFLGYCWDTIDDDQVGRRHDEGIPRTTTWEISAIWLA